MAPVPIPAASVCFRCQNPGSSPEKFMLQCCECKRTWHHTCHAPPVPEKDLIEGIRAFNDNHVENIFTMWTCKRCGKKPKASGSRAPSSAVDERRATLNNGSAAPSRPPTGALPKQPIVAPEKSSTVVPQGPPALAPLSKHTEPRAPPPLGRGAPSKSVATALPSVTYLGASQVPPAQSQTNPSARPPQPATSHSDSPPLEIPQPSRLVSTTQANPFPSRLVGTTSKKTTSSKRSAKVSIASATSTVAPSLSSSTFQQRPGPPASSWRPNAPLLQPTASFASSASLASATSSRATSLSSLAINRPRSADGTVIDLGDRLEEMNVDTPHPGSTPHSAFPVPRAARTGVGLDEITALLRARPTYHAQVRTLAAAPKPSVPGVSLPYEWLSQRHLEKEAKRSDTQNAAPCRRSRKAVATKGHALQAELLIVGGAVAGAWLKEDDVRADTPLRVIK
ncbi:hypothetical protein EV121DRAFT_191466 [Schizophyllum commune]